MPGSIENDAIASPQGAIPQSMILKRRIRKPTKYGAGGFDRRHTEFSIATEVAAAIVEVAPKSMREIHGILTRTNSDIPVWNGRMTVFRFTGFLPEPYSRAADVAAQLVKSHLGMDQSTIDRLSKSKKPIV